LWEQYKVVLFLAKNASWQKTQIFGYGCLLAVIVISPLCSSMVHGGAAWCRVVQIFFLCSKIVADMLLKISGIQMSNKMGAKRPKWRKLTVGLKTRKPLTSKGFRYQLLFLFIVDYRRLFADTELREDRPQNIRIHVDVARDVSEVTHRCADVHRNEVACGANVQSFLGFA